MLAGTFSADLLDMLHRAVVELKIDPKHYDLIEDREYLERTLCHALYLRYAQVKGVPVTLVREDESVD